MTTPRHAAAPEAGAGRPGALARDPYAVVVPSIGRPSLLRLLETLAAQAESSPSAPAPTEVVVADDRRLPLPGRGATGSSVPGPLDLGEAGDRLGARVVRTGGRGPAAARNAGWRSTSAPWVVFLDDDVELPAGWAGLLAADLAAADDRTGGVQGRLHVPLPTDRRPTDWERGTAGLQDALWPTADMAYRRAALEQVSGFDERFPRAYREDADLALRVRDAGWNLERGTRTTTHPVRPTDDGVSLRVQAGTRDDATMRALHGPDWRERAETGRGRLAWHVATVAAAGVGVAGMLARRRRVAALGAAAWAGLTLDFARRRLAPGPRPGDDVFGAELRRMLWTSAAIPFAAVRHRVAGTVAARRGLDPWPPPLAAVLFDRDGTLVHDVPYNGDRAEVRPVEGARAVLDDLRARGVRVGVVSNQSGIARGLLTREQVDAVNARVEELLGPFDTWQVCPHGPDDACACRKPAPGMVLAAAAELGVPPWRCAVVGDIGADVGAAVAAGAVPVLVPTPVTRPEEVDAAPRVAPDLAAAVTMLDDRRHAAPPEGVTSRSAGSHQIGSPRLPISRRSADLGGRGS
ncbi:HAD-IIIA family hydrolase [Cellulosimicrobium sp. Marseille-Q4280]|uniref:HAD-IIIA family hydrolase n=1 Tax=Cellulosimicrobium sp. Marseille-Q4280 TaxID=2937992 RepID=UPI0033375350